MTWGIVMIALDWIAFALAVPLGFLGLCVACVVGMALRDMGGRK